MTKLTTLTLIGLTMACASDYELTGDRPDVNPGDVTECGLHNLMVQIFNPTIVIQYSPIRMKNGVVMLDQWDSMQQT